MSEAMQKWASEAPEAYAPPAFVVSDFLSPYQVTMRAYITTTPEYDGLATAAVVFDPATLDSESADPKLLVIQRAAHDSMPLRWEVPGGACDWEDASVLHGLARELWEEAGLVATNVRRTIDPPMVFFTRSQRRIIKFSFLVDVEGGTEVKLDPNEHVAFRWITEQEFRERRCGETTLTFTTREQEGTIQTAFELVRRTDGKGGPNKDETS
jgi:8-oxo-dGTP pyrophosphatase MutT (NUDIX family)